MTRVERSLQRQKSDVNLLTGSKEFSQIAGERTQDAPLVGAVSRRPRIGQLLKGEGHHHNGVLKL